MVMKNSSSKTMVFKEKNNNNNDDNNITIYIFPNLNGDISLVGQTQQAT